MLSHTIILLGLLVTTLSIVSSVPDRSLDEEWATFKLAFKKSYSSNIEETIRRLLWEQNVRYIQKHNLRASMGIDTYFLSMNKFGDLSGPEYASLFRSNTNSSGQHDQYPVLGNINTAVPPSIDWRSKGCVRPAISQNGLESWAFAAAESLESQVCVKTGKMVELSVQNLIDCVTGYGSVANALGYVLNNGGIDTEASYPRESRKGHCRFNKQTIGAKIKGVAMVNRGNEKDLQEKVATIGPIAAYIDASQPSFQLYHGGIYNDPNCSSDKLDHVVVVVGYGTTEHGTDFWIVKNNWGSSWGINGYILMSRNRNNQCGIASRNAFAIV